MTKKKLRLITMIIGLQAFLGCSQSPQGTVEGLRKSFYEGGQIESEKTYLKGELSGPARIYYENGQLAWEGRYLNGKLDGSGKFFYDTGVIQAVRSYADGIQTGQAKIFSPTGALMANFNIEKGRKNGEATYFYLSGVPLKKETYVSGIKEGPETIFSREGQPKSTRIYRNGLPIGGPPAAEIGSAAVPPTGTENRLPSSANIPKTASASAARPVTQRHIPSPEELMQAVARAKAQNANPAVPAQAESKTNSLPEEVPTSLKKLE